MRPLLVVCALALVVPPAKAYEEDEPAKKPGLASRTWHTLTSPFAHEEKPGTVRVKNLALSMELAPEPVKLSETRQIKVALSLTNKSRKLVHLQFPTTQRIEVLIRDKDGKLVTQWSEDQSFANESTFVAINPGERIEYTAAVATRDLAPGREYVVEGFFPNFDELKVRKTIVPVK